MNLSQWLKSDQNYQAGVELYKQLGTSSVWKNILAQGETDYNRTRLTELLTELSQKEIIVLPDPVQVIASQSENSESLLARLKAQWLPLYKRMSHLHSQLVHIPSKEREEAAFEILSLEKQINRIWQQEKYLIQHGHLPADSISQSQAAHDLSTAIGMQKRILNLRVSLSKHKNNPDRKQDLAKWTTEKADLEKQLNQLS